MTDNNIITFADTGNNRVRRIATDGTISTIAGDGTAGFAGDGGAATAASLSAPRGVFVDGAGNIYIADSGNNRIRKVDTAGNISTVAGGGTGGDGGAATDAVLNNPTDVAVTPDGQIIIAEAGNNKIRGVNAKGIIRTVAGTGAASFGGDGGLATTARLNNPVGIGLSNSNGPFGGNNGNSDIFVADTGNNRIRLVGGTMAPGATTRAATNATMTSATLNATVLRNDSAATAEFQYGLTTDYGTNVPVAVPAGTNSGNDNLQNVTVDLTGLMPNQTYHFRIVATNSVDTTFGQDVTFSTGDAAPSLVVTTLSNQSSASDNETTLVEAVNFANSDPDASEITFAPGLKGTIVFDDSTQIRLDISTPITLTGPGANVITVEQRVDNDLFSVPQGTPFSVSGLTLSFNGQGTTSGIFNSAGTVKVDSCVVRGFGYGIANGFGNGDPNAGTSSLTVSNTTIANSQNAGIRAYDGQFTLVNSTIAGGAGDGVLVSNQQLNLRASKATSTGLSAALQTASRLLNCTITGNGGSGVNDGGTGILTANNCLIVGNGTDVVGTLNGANNITTGTPAAAGLDPAGLKDNGGPTPTIALLSGGSAVNAGDNAAAQGLEFDQRGAGFPRITGAAVDIGAFELSNNPPTLQNVAIATDEDKTFAFAADSFDGGFSDPDAGNTLQSVRIDSLPANGTLNLDGVAVTAGQNIARADLNKLTYVPTADFNGADSFDYNASDGVVFAAQGAKVNITVNAVNDVPSFTVGAAQTADEDAASQSVAKFIADAKAGPANEAAQKLTFIVTNDNNALFSAQPAIDASGTLTFTSAADANGVATISVKLKDDGGNDNGGVDTSAAQSFTLTVNAVNDAPSFNVGADQTVAEAAGAQSVANFASNLKAGPANEGAQKLTFIVTNDNNALFSVQPAIDASGTLTYTVAPKAAGKATISVKLQDDGGVARGGVDTSAAQSFTINVTANPLFTAFL